jgi:hypothetical protein
MIADDLINKLIRSAHEFAEINGGEIHYTYYEGIIAYVKECSMDANPYIDEDNPYSSYASKACWDDGYLWAEGEISILAKEAAEIAKEAAKHAKEARAVILAKEAAKIAEEAARLLSVNWRGPRP